MIIGKGCPTPQPTASPTASPTAAPTLQPTAVPTLAPASPQPTALPSAQPTALPSPQPTLLPTAVPTSPFAGDFGTFSTTTYHNFGTGSLSVFQQCFIVPGAPSSCMLFRDTTGYRGQIADRLIEVSSPRPSPLDRFSVLDFGRIFASVFLFMIIDISIFCYPIETRRKEVSQKKASRTFLQFYVLNHASLFLF